MGERSGRGEASGVAEGSHLVRTHGGPAGLRRLVLYVRPGCHLCDEAREVLTDVVGPGGWDEVDIDAAPPGERLVERYGEMVPVVTVDGVPQGYWRLDAGRVARALAAGGG